MVRGRSRYLDGSEAKVKEVTVSSEKAGVGGSIPSLTSNNFNNLQIAKNIQKSS